MFDLKRKSRSLGSTAQKMKFSVKDFFGKCDQIRKKLRIWSQLLKKLLMENFIFCAVKRTKFMRTFQKQPPYKKAVIFIGKQRAAFLKRDSSKGVFQ